MAVAKGASVKRRRKGLESRVTEGGMWVSMESMQTSLFGWIEDETTHFWGIDLGVDDYDFGCEVSLIFEGLKKVMNVGCMSVGIETGNGDADGNVDGEAKVKCFGATEVRNWSGNK